jgi:drug/metabolite transporter (DMT)-like permease
MQWFVLSLMTALATSTQDAWVKKNFSDLGPYEMCMYPLLFSLPLFAMAFPFVDTPSLDSEFWFAFLICIPIDGLAFLLYMESIRVSPLSLTIPYLALTPAFILITGHAVLQELPNLAGILGVFTTVVGSYILNLNTRDRHFLAPFKAITSEKGSWLMCIVAILYSFASVLGKKAILHSSPMFYAVFYCLTLNSLVLLALLVSRRITPHSFTRRLRQGFVVGLLFFLHVILHNLAVSLTKVSYMISVKRLSIAFSVLYGGFLFHEEQMPSRLAGTSLMIAGAIVISIWGK